MTIKSGPAQGQSVEVDGEVVIGREGSDLEVPDPEVSRRHALVRAVERGVEIEDLGSTNGTIVGGKRIEAPMTLTESASIQVGDTDIELELPVAGDTTRAGDIRLPTPGGGLALERTLRVIWGPAAGKSLPLDEEVVIGRQGADLTIPDPELSRRHAAIRPVPQGAEIEDLGSTNGTFVNGERITAPVTLTASGKLSLGTTEIELELHMPGATQVSSRPPEFDVRSRVAATFDPRSAVALQEAEAEAVEVQAEQPEEPAMPDPDALPPNPPLPAAAARFGITEDNRRRWALAAMCCGVGMVSLDTTVINVALPTIQRDLKVPLSGLEWTVNAYTLALAVLLVTGGRLGDIYGRRRNFVIGVVVFAVSSMACGLAPDEGTLIAARSVQGVGAAIMMPMTLSILGTVFPLTERGKAIGAWAGMSGVAMALGPVVGGVLTTNLSWRAVFYINVPIAILAVIVTLLAVPESRDEEVEKGLDLPGNIIFSLSLGALLLGLIEGPDWGWGSPKIVGLLVGAVVGLLVFLVIEQRVRVPMIDFSALKAPLFIGANLAGFAGYFVMLSLLVYVAVYMQSVLHYDALEAGLRFVPGTALVAIAAPRSGRLIGRVAPRYLIATGLILVAGAALVLTRIGPDTGYGLLIPSMVLIGVGIGTMLPPMSASALMSVRREKAGLGSGVLSMSRQLGAAFGVAIVGTIFQTLTRSNIKDNLAGVPLSGAQKNAIADAGLSGAAAPRPSGLSASAAAHVTSAVRNGIVDALATANYVPVALAIAGALAVLVLVDRPKPDAAPAAEPAPAAH